MFLKETITVKDYVVDTRSQVFPPMTTVRCGFPVGVDGWGSLYRDSYDYGL